MNNKKRNIIVFSSAYFFLALLIVILTFGVENELASGVAGNVGLVLVNLLIISPGFALIFLLMFFRINLFLETKDVFVLFMPRKGSKADPVIDANNTKKGKVILNTFLVLLMISLVVVFVLSIINSV